MHTCPTCGQTGYSPKEFVGVAMPLAMPESLAEMVDGIIEATGYGGSVD